MSIRNIFLITFSLACFAADQKPEFTIDSKMCAAVLAVGLYASAEFKMQCAMRNTVSDRVIVDQEGRQGVMLAYTPEQRIFAQTRQQGITLGLAGVTGLVLHSGMPFNVIKGLSSHSLILQLLAPAVVYNETKNFLDSLISDSSSFMRSTIAGVSACTIPQLFIAHGMSPDQMVVNAFCAHTLTHQHNKYSNTKILKDITGSLAKASKIAPCMQFFMSRFNTGARLLKFHSCLGNEINLSTEFMRGVIPVLVHAGVDLTFNAIAATSIGQTIEHRIVDPVLNSAVMPLPEKVRKPTARIAKKVLFEGSKIGTTATVLTVAPGAGCTIV